MKVNKLFSNRNIFIFATLIFVVWMLFFDRNNFLESRLLDDRIRELEAEKAYHQHKISADSAVIEGLKDSAFLERYSRENFLMHLPDEEIYLIDDK